ncbi:hypothetical protein J6590_094564 [Homalodisca vitripennis]|nr:hypothetical protein J6590_094564 [Homalodisca vitripennis]
MVLLICSEPLYFSPTNGSIEPVIGLLVHESLQSTTVHLPLLLFSAYFPSRCAFVLQNIVPRV